MNVPLKFILFSAVMLDGVVQTAPSAKSVLTVTTVDVSVNLLSASVTMATMGQLARTPSAEKDAIMLM